MAQRHHYAHARACQHFLLQSAGKVGSGFKVLRSKGWGYSKMCSEAAFRFGARLIFSPVPRVIKHCASACIWVVSGSSSLLVEDPAQLIMHVLDSSVLSK